MAFSNRILTGFELGSIIRKIQQKATKKHIIEDFNIFPLSFVGFRGNFGALPVESIPARAAGRWGARKNREV
jgi:hypothetical protein